MTNYAGDKYFVYFWRKLQLAVSSFFSEV